jgi:transposase
MTATHRRHGILDEVWTLLEPHLPWVQGCLRGRAKDNKRFINAVLFGILRTGAPWRDLPPDYGDWKNTHRRFCRWPDADTWEGLLEKLVDNPDFQWLMIDASYLKVPPHTAGVKGGNQAMSRAKEA